MPFPRLALTAGALALAPLLISALAQGAAGPGAGLAAERARLLAADRAFAQGAAALPEPEGLAAIMADDVVLLLDGHPVVRGRESARRALAGEPGAAAARHRWQPVFADVSRDGTRGYTLGYAERVGAAGDTARFHARYIAFWRRAADGTWRAAAYLRNRVPDPAPTPLPPAPEPTEVEATPLDAEAGRAAVMRADADFARLGKERGPAVAFTTYVADNSAHLGGPQGFIFGAEVRKGYERFTPGLTIDWAPVLGELAPSGDLGFTVGEAVIRGPAPDGSTRTSYSKYLSIWKRQPDGELRFVIDSGNRRPGP